MMMTKMKRRTVKMKMQQKFLQIHMAALEVLETLHDYFQYNSGSEEAFHISINLKRLFFKKKNHKKILDCKLFWESIIGVK